MATPIPSETENVGNQLQLKTDTGELYVNYGARGTEKLVTQPELEGVEDNLNDVILDVSSLQTEINGLESNKVDKSGDTMSGALNIDMGSIGDTNVIGFEIRNPSGSGSFNTPSFNFKAGSYINRSYYKVSGRNPSYINETSANNGASYIEVFNITDSRATFRNSLAVKNNNGFDGMFLSSALSANRSYTLPNSSGTLALESDIPDVSGKANLAGGNTFTGGIQTLQGDDTYLLLNNSQGTSYLVGSAFGMAGTNGKSVDFLPGELFVKPDVSSVGKTIALYSLDAISGKAAIAIGTNKIHGNGNVSSVTLPSADGTLATEEYVGKMFTYTTSGNDSTTVFTVPHGLSYTPTMVLVTPNSRDAIGKFVSGPINTNINNLWASVDASNVTINFIFPPVLGTDNLTWTIWVK